ncbi:hypothetical protein [Sphingobacterium sp. DR205]|uniref:hypothetical protein n=1 Tax=Sphingobacterium sp. DR205 TaxID=2713573 RepID=UPI0013E4F4B6|nr:hypothetical protein [Sphingobacterium sp. DR205]QIH32544.1 hypothetical protein G6053_06400 [Sphingobacterium sp. DR205]
MYTLLFEVINIKLRLNISNARVVYTLHFEIINILEEVVYPNYLSCVYPTFWDHQHLASADIISIPVVYTPLFEVINMEKGLLYKEDIAVYTLHFEIINIIWISATAGLFSPTSQWQQLSTYKEAILPKNACALYRIKGMMAYLRIVLLQLAIEMPRTVYKLRQIAAILA